MTDNIVQFDGWTTADEPAEQLLEKAKSWGLETVLVIGLDADGELLAGGNSSDRALNNLILDMAKRDMLP